MMTKKLLLVGVWLAAGHGVVAACFWALINVPESNVGMLALSAVLVLLMLIIAAVVTVTAVGWLTSEGTLRSGVTQSLSGVVVFALGLVIAGLIWWAGARLGAWVTEHSGEIDAWMISSLFVANTRWLHVASSWIVAFIQYVVALSLASTLIVDAVTRGWSSIVSARWIARVLSPTRLALVAVTLLICLWVPAQLAYWRPAALPASVVELLFAGAKLAMLAFLMNLGWAILLWSAIRTTDHGTPFTT